MPAGGPYDLSPSSTGDMEEDPGIRLEVTDDTVVKMHQVSLVLPCAVIPQTGVSSYYLEFMKAASSPTIFGDQQCSIIGWNFFVHHESAKVKLTKLNHALDCFASGCGGERSG